LRHALKILSLFDGISCGRLALDRAGYAVSGYAAFETDKFARSVSRYNYPDIRRYGDVLDADFSEFAGYDIVMGGSPCTFWSIAKANREVDKNGMGWKLFMRFAEAVEIIKPRYFLYENVASMPKDIKAHISDELGCEPILMNSALLSAQSRKRLYWTDIGGIAQPEDKGILLKDILETGLAAEQTDSAAYSPIRIGHYGTGGQGNRIYSVHGKTVALMANGGGRGGKVGLYKIDLPDGDYIVRKLTPIEAERCQTLPDNYTAHGINDKGNIVNISDTQRYRAVGNGWTVDIIAHILQYMNF
jgi:DNA (cytosine-5)-methyltransferase 3A